MVATPKKTAATGDDASEDNTKFSWTGENERKLLLLTHPFPGMSAQDINNLLPLFPGTNFNGIRIRYSLLRRLSVGMEGSAAAASAIATPEKNKGTPKKQTPRKRARREEDEVPSPQKKVKGEAVKDKTETKSEDVKSEDVKSEDVKSEDKSEDVKDEVKSEVECQWSEDEI